jgi:cAMP-dependent protein kinase regulator
LCQAGEKVITEGDNGDFLFVIEKGTLNCIKSVNGEEKVVKTVNEGDVFGELALLYNCPRAASVMAADVLWQRFMAISCVLSFYNPK